MPVESYQCSYCVPVACVIRCCDCVLWDGKPTLKQPLSNAVGSAVSGVMNFWVGDTALPGLSDDISLDLTRAVGPQVNQQIIPALAQTLPDTLTESLTAALTKYCVFSITNKLTQTLLPEITKELTASIPQKANIEMPKVLSMQVARDMG